MPKTKKDQGRNFRKVNLISKSGERVSGTRKRQRPEQNASEKKIVKNTKQIMGIPAQVTKGSNGMKAKCDTLMSDVSTMSRVDSLF